MARDRVFGRVRRAHRWSMVAAVALALTACGPQDLEALRARGDASAGASDAAPSTTALAPATKSHQQASVKAATLSAQMKTAASDVRYAVVPGDDAPLVAKSASRGIEGRFDERGVALSSGSAGAGWSGRLDVVGYGCATDGKLAEVTSGAPVRDGNDANRLSYVRHAGREMFTESWVNGEPGLEQTFTVERTPCSASAGGGTAWFEIDAGGLTPELVAATADKTAEVLLRDGVSGRVRAHYSDAYAEDATGRAVPVVMDVNGGRVVIDVDVAGARFPVRVDPLVWGLQQQLADPDGSFGDYYGLSAALSGDTALVGNYEEVPGDDTSAGEVFVFVRSGATWTKQATLGSGAVGDYFGWSLAVSSDTALIGAPDTAKGTAYVFVRSGTTWTQQGGALTASDGASGDGFGESVSVSGDTALIGAYYKNAGQGAAYVFVRSGTTWTQQGGDLVASDGVGYFGISVSVSGDTALVGANGSGVIQGAAYVFVRSGTTWTQQGGDLVASDGAAADDFGGSVAVSGNTALLGASAKTVSGNTQQGAAYAFVRSGTTWSQQGVDLVAPDGAAKDNFGDSVSVSGSTLLVGASEKKVGANPYGAAYVFVASGTTWAQQGPTLEPSSGQTFGAAVSVSGDTILVGARSAAYVFVALGASCTSNSQCGSAACVDGFCCDTPCANSCDVCAKSLGATADGLCTTLPAGSVGSPACGTLSCNGTSATCAACSTDAQCPSGKYCAADGTCEAEKAQGSACNAAAGADCDKASCRVCGTPGGCVDGFCCNTTCGNVCDVCAASMGATADGTCGPATVGLTLAGCSSPHACDGVSVTCAPGSNSCASDADCASGYYCGFGAVAGTCVLQKVVGATCNALQGADCATADCRDCASGFCATGVCCTTACAGGCAQCGSGACQAAPQGTAVASCAGYACDGTSLVCPTTCAAPKDCASGYSCVSGACIGTQTLGKACTDGAECSTGNCVDGVCCNVPCNDQCQWCDDPANPGTCEAAPEGQPKGTRQACSGSGACLGQCDGAKVDGCVYPGSATQCAPATCVNDSILTASTCDTAGGCAAGDLQDCGGYTCDPAVGACKTACTTKSDCRLGAVCDTSSGTGTCNAAGATCVDAYNVKASDGTVSSCNGYQCVSGACQQQCGTGADCAPGYDCTGSSCFATGTGTGGASNSGGATSASTGGTSTTGSTGGAATASGGSTGTGTGGASATSSGGTPTTGADAGAQPPNGAGGEAGSATSKDAGGCGCRMSGGSDSRSTHAAVLAALGLVALRRRRRPRERADSRLVYPHRGAR